MEKTQEDFIENRFVMRNGEWHVQGGRLAEGHLADVVKGDGTITQVLIEKIIYSKDGFKIGAIAHDPYPSSSSYEFRL